MNGSPMGLVMPQFDRHEDQRGPATEVQADLLNKHFIEHTDECPFRPGAMLQAKEYTQNGQQRMPFVVMEVLDETLTSASPGIEPEELNSSAAVLRATMIVAVFRGHSITQFAVDHNEFEYWQGGTNNGA